MRHVARAHVPCDKNIFELFPGMGAVSAGTARDIFNVCRVIEDGRQREACYASFGVDGSNIEKYLTTVEEMEKMYSIAVQQEEMSRAKRLRIGPWVLYFGWVGNSKP